MGFSRLLRPTVPTLPAKPVLGGFQPLTPPTVPAAATYPTTPASPGGSLYSSPPTGGYVPPVDGFRPATSYGAPANVAPVAAFPTQPQNFEIPTTLPKNHPWLIKPEHGAYFIMVKSYVRPAKGSKAAEEDKGLSAPELAEMLAREIRDIHRVQAFLYEYISEEPQGMEMRKRTSQPGKRPKPSTWPRFAPLSKRANCKGWNSSRRTKRFAS